MAKSVENGVINTLSPSMINKFDSAAPFGCERRWWFRYVKGLPEAQTGNQELGEKLHALLEARIGKRDLSMVIPPEDDAYGLYLAGEPMVREIEKRTILSVEASLLNFTLDGTKCQGFVDVVTSDGIIDWKTSSDIRRYGKSAADLATDAQMVIYGLAMHPDLAKVKLAHGQFQTKGNKRTGFAEVEVTKEHLASHRDKVIVPLIQKMKSAASEKEVAKLERNPKSCFNCPHKSYCPGETTVMSFFKKLNPAPAVEAAPVVQPVLPPDAPKSEPALAAKPVEGFSPIPAPRRQLIAEPAPTPAEKVVEKIDAELARVEAKDENKSLEQVAAEAPQENLEPVKRGRGRPPGAKNKPKESAPEMQTGPVEFVTPGLPQCRTVTVTKGYTINLGNYNSARIEVSASFDGADFDATFAAALAKVEASLEAEAAKYEAVANEKGKA